MYNVPTMHDFCSLVSIVEEWPTHTKRLRKEFPHLTDEELKMKISEEKEVLERLRARLENGSDESIRIILR